MYCICRLTWSMSPVSLITHGMPLTHECVKLCAPHWLTEVIAQVTLAGPCHKPNYSTLWPEQIVLCWSLNRLCLVACPCLFGTL